MQLFFFELWNKEKKKALPEAVSSIFNHLLFINFFLCRKDQNIILKLIFKACFEKWIQWNRKLSFWLYHSINRYTILNIVQTWKYETIYSIFIKKFILKYSHLIYYKSMKLFYVHGKCIENYCDARKNWWKAKSFLYMYSLKSLIYVYLDPCIPVFNGHDDFFFFFFIVFKSNSWKG